MLALAWALPVIFFVLISTAKSFLAKKRTLFFRVTATSWPATGQLSIFPENPRSICSGFGAQARTGLALSRKSLYLSLIAGIIALFSVFMLRITRRSLPRQMRYFTEQISLYIFHPPALRLQFERQLLVRKPEAGFVNGLGYEKNAVCSQINEFLPQDPLVFTVNDNPEFWPRGHARV